MKKILIIEDNRKHHQDAQAFFSTVKEIEVTYAISYRSFSSLTKHNNPGNWIDLSKFDGVISDIYFPEDHREEPQPIGVSIMFQCKILNIPCVLCTAGYHHGSQYNWINSMIYALRNAGWETIPKMIDSLEGTGKPKKDAPEDEQVAKKGWSKAWKELKKYL